MSSQEDPSFLVSAKSSFVQRKNIRSSSFTDCKDQLWYIKHHPPSTISMYQLQPSCRLPLDKDRSPYNVPRQRASPSSSASWTSPLKNRRIQSWNWSFKALKNWKIKPWNWRYKTFKIWGKQSWHRILYQHVAIANEDIDPCLLLRCLEDRVRPEKCAAIQSLRKGF